jgi:hypothetical protein
MMKGLLPVVVTEIIMVIFVMLENKNWALGWMFSIAFGNVKVVKWINLSLDANIGSLLSEQHSCSNDFSSLSIVRKLCKSLF